MIDWTEEVEIIYKCLRLVAKPHEPSMSSLIFSACLGPDSVRTDDSVDRLSPEHN